MNSPVKSILVALLFTTGTTAYAQTPSAADKAFVAKVSQGGMYEVAASRLAATKGSTQDIRDLGIAEVHDHTLVGAKLKKISVQAGITFSPDLNASFSAKLQHLSTLSGTDFDAAYLADMGTIHDMDGAAFAVESTKGGTAAYRAFGAETYRIVQRHIGAIKAIPAK